MVTFQAIPLPEPTEENLQEAREFVAKEREKALEYEHYAENNLVRARGWFGIVRKFRAEMWYEKALDVYSPLSSMLGSNYPAQLKDLKDDIDRKRNDIETILQRDFGRVDPFLGIYGK